MSRIYDYRLRSPLRQDENSAQNEGSVIQELQKVSVGDKPKSFDIFVNSQGKGIELQSLNQQSESQMNRFKQVTPLPAVDPEIQDLVSYLRQPERLHTKYGPFLSEMLSEFHSSEPSSQSYIFERPKRFPGRWMLNSFVPISIRSEKLLPTTRKLDLSPVARTSPAYHDAMPFFNCAEYETRLDTDDYEGICLAILEDEIYRLTEKKSVTFERQLELNERKDHTHWYDYPLYYLFGVDRSGFFNLREISDDYNRHPWSRFTTATVGYMDDTCDDSNENLAQPGTDVIDTESEMSLDFYL